MSSDSGGNLDQLEYYIPPVHQDRNLEREIRRNSSVTQFIISNGRV